MRQKQQADACQCDDKAAGAMAAASVAKYFKENGWKIISFFPNATCGNRVQKILHTKSGKKRGRKSSKKSGI